jgi:hypothetical protein
MLTCDQRRIDPGLRHRQRGVPVSQEACGRVGVLWRFGLALLLAGYLLFAHGCHGHEDNELFSSGIVRPAPADLRATRINDPGARQDRYPGPPC